MSGRVDDDPAALPLHDQFAQELERDRQHAGIRRGQGDGLIGNGGECPFGEIDVFGIVVRRRPPLDPRQQPFDRVARGWHTAKVQAGDVTPGERDRLAVDGHAHPLAVGLPDRSIELIADHEPGFILSDIELEAGRRFREADQLQVVEVACQRPSSGAACADGELASRIATKGPSGPLPWASSLPSTDASVCVGAKPEREAVPARRPSQPLHGQDRSATRPRGSPPTIPMRHAPSDKPEVP